MYVIIKYIFGANSRTYKWQIYLKVLRSTNNTIMARFTYILRKLQNPKHANVLQEWNFKLFTLNYFIL